MARNTLGFDAGSLKLASPAQSLAPIKGIPGFTNGKKRSSGTAPRVIRAIFGYGQNGGSGSPYWSITNIVSGTGVVATDTTGVGTARAYLAAAGYGTDKAIFGYGWITPALASGENMTNLVSNTGVVSTDTTGVGTARMDLAAAGYSTDKAIFGYGVNNNIDRSMTNLVSNTGVVATDTTGVGTARNGIAATSFG